ncbi:hypothetical protein PYW07_013133 [Mythimna separata]|uniref:Uncharacterized protein n=1 Tax=Mythimna separata TaxID=271217 RepID=A0AAD8DJZ6_MYTSE|nr:hypothetical protein PYW07_013133 [Mythimna separata]
MASTIVAEDECNQIIMNLQDPIKIASTTIVEDESNQIVNKTNENNTEQQIEKPNPIDVEIIEILSEEESQDSEYSSNVIILGTKENQSTENPNYEVGYTVHDDDDGTASEEDGNTSEDEGNSSHDEGNVTVLGEGRPKSKRRMKSELERLLLDTKMRSDGIEEDYDGFGDESTIFRKYKLRKSEQTVSYKEHTDIKPKRRNDDDERDLNCPVCKEDCDTMVTLLHHLRTHNRSIHGYTCSLCAEKFDRNAHLIAHRQKHTEDSFLCQECKTPPKRRRASCLIMGPCCVQGCEVTSEETYYFEFPTSRILRRKWLELIPIPGKLPLGTVVCSRHFSAEDYESVRGKVRLKRKVVPSRLLQQAFCPRTLLLAACWLHGGWLHVGWLPTSMVLRRRWQELIPIPGKLPLGTVVCSRHFSAEDYESVRGKVRLKRKVVPSRLLQQVTWPRFS